MRFEFQPFTPQQSHIFSLKRVGLSERNFAQVTQSPGRKSNPRAARRYTKGSPGLAHTDTASFAHLHANRSKIFLWPRREQEAEVTFWRLKLTSVTAGTTITTRWLGRPLHCPAFSPRRPTRRGINHEKQFRTSRAHSRPDAVLSMLMMPPSPPPLLPLPRPSKSRALINNKSDQAALARRSSRIKACAR